MKKNDVAVFAVLNLVYLFVACMAASAVAFLVLWGVNLFVPVSFFARAIVHTVVVLAASVSVCAVLAYRDGYRYANFILSEAFLSAAIAALIHFGLGLALRFWPFAFGLVRNASGLLAFGKFYTVERVAAIPYGILIAVGIVMMLVYVGVFVLANRQGCAKRLRDRAETTEGLQQFPTSLLTHWE